LGFEIGSALGFGLRLVLVALSLLGIPGLSGPSLLALTFALGVTALGFEFDKAFGFEELCGLVSLALQLDATAFLLGAITLILAPPSLAVRVAFSLSAFKPFLSRLFRGEIKASGFGARRLIAFPRQSKRAGTYSSSNSSNGSVTLPR
jgi:hypothetical protein